MEIATEDEDGDPVAGERRLRAFRTAQAIFAGRPALILFDEIEDVFNNASPFSGHRSTGQSRSRTRQRRQAVSLRSQAPKTPAAQIHPRRVRGQRGRMRRSLQHARSGSTPR